MRKNQLLIHAALCSVLVLLSPPILAAENALLAPAGTALINAQPRQVVSTAFQVTNRGAPDQFETRLILPEGWRAITPDLPIHLNAGQSSTAFVSFFIPDGTLSGRYPIRHQLRSLTHPAYLVTAEITVVIAPVHRLEAAVLDAPQTVAAGNTITVTYLIRNTGNSDTIVNYSLSSSTTTLRSPAQGSVRLKPGEARQIEVRAVANEVHTTSPDVMTLVATETNHNVRTSTSASYTVLPSAGGLADRYHMLASTITLRSVFQDDKNAHHTGLQAELAGAGTIDEAGKQHLDYLLRAPNMQTDSSLGLMNEWHVRYWDDHKQVALGDNIYSLSPLTESGRYGNGIDLGYQGDVFGLYGYQMNDRDSTAPQREHAWTARLNESKDAHLDFNVLDKQGPVNGRLSSLRQVFAQPKLFADFETATSRTDAGAGNAWRALITDTRYAYHYDLSLLHADPRFKGSYSDQNYLSLDFDRQINPSWSWHGFVRHQDSNLGRLPNQAAPDQQQANAGLFYQLSKSARLGLDVNGNRQIDRSTLAQFDTLHETTRLTFLQNLKQVSLSAIGEWGIMDDHVHQTAALSSLYMLSATWVPEARRTFGAFLSYDHNTYSSTIQPAQSTIGVMANYGFARSSWLAANAQISRRNGANQVSYFINANHQLTDGQTLSIQLRRLITPSVQTDAVLAWTMPFNAPITQRRDVGFVHGRLTDQESGKPMTGVTLHMGDAITVTDAQGNYRFPALRTAVYFMTFDQTPELADKTTTVEMPMQVKIEAGVMRQINLAFMRSITLSGHVLMPVQSVKSMPSQMLMQAHGNSLPMQGMAGAVVIMKRGGHEYRRLTDQDGNFSLSGLLPGQWHIQLAPDGIPDDLRTEQEAFDLNVLPGGKAEVIFRLQPKIRAIHMQSGLHDVSSP